MLPPFNQLGQLLPPRPPQPPQPPQPPLPPLPPPLPPPPSPPNHVGEQGGPWDSVSLDPAFFPALQTTLPMTAVYIKHRVDGWTQHVLIAESALLRRAGAPTGLGVYALRRFKGPRELTTPRMHRVEGDTIGSYGGTVVSNAPTRREAVAAANKLMQQRCDYMLSIRIPHRRGWFVVDGSQHPVMPFMHRVNDSRGTPLLPRCSVSEYGLFRAARDIPALDWTRPLRDQAVSELSFDYCEDYWRTHVGTHGSTTTLLEVGSVISSLDQLALSVKNVPCAVAVDGLQNGCGERRRYGDEHLAGVHLESEQGDGLPIALV